MPALMRSMFPSTNASYLPGAGQPASDPAKRWMVWWTCSNFAGSVAVLDCDAFGTIARLAGGCCSLRWFGGIAGASSLWQVPALCSPRQVQRRVAQRLTLWLEQGAGDAAGVWAGVSATAAGCRDADGVKQHRIVANNAPVAQLASRISLTKARLTGDHCSNNMPDRPTVFAAKSGHWASQRCTPCRLHGMRREMPRWLSTKRLPRR